MNTIPLFSLMIQSCWTFVEKHMNPIIYHCLHHVLIRKAQAFNIISLGHHSWNPINIQLARWRVKLFPTPIRMSDKRAMGQLFQNNGSTKTWRQWKRTEERRWKILDIFLGMLEKPPEKMVWWCQYSLPRIRHRRSFFLCCLARAYYSLYYIISLLRYYGLTQNTERWCWITCIIAASGNKNENQ